MSAGPASTQFLPRETRVLVVDDSPTMGSIYRQLLRGVGVQNVTQATSGIEAIEAVGLTKPHVALIDYQMGDLTGVELTRLLRSAPDSPAPDLPIVLITAHASQAVLKEAIAAGVDAFVAKPVSAGALAQHVRTAIEKRGRLAAQRKTALAMNAG